MTLSGLRARAKAKRTRIKTSDGAYTVVDTQNDLTVGQADNLITLEELLDHIDTP